VTIDPATYDEVRATPLRILQGVRVLHARGYHRVRVQPRMSPSGVHWRVAIRVTSDARRIDYTTGGSKKFAGGEVGLATDPEAVADLILAALPGLAPTADDPAYVAWFAALMRLVEGSGGLPIADADYFDDRDGWEVGWGSGVRHPHPPAPAHG
jgi:hypothetical protein